MVRRVVWLPVAGLGLWTLARVLGLDRGFPLDPLMTWTPFVAIAAVVLAVVVAALRVRLAALVAAVCAVVLVAVVAPRALGGPSAAAGGTARTITVLTVNLRRGGADPAAVVALVRRTDADVLSLQEVSPASVTRLRAAGLDALMPGSVVRLARRYDGTALFSRVPLHPLPGPRHTWNPFAAARADFGGIPVRLIAVHPPAPVSGDRVAGLRHDLRALPSAGSGPVRILVGDFNSTLDNGELRRLIGRGYEDAADAVGAGLEPTWPVGGRVRPPVTIDHVLADARCGERAARTFLVPNTDHRAFMARIALPTAG